LLIAFLLHYVLLSRPGILRLTEARNGS